MTAKDLIDLLAALASDTEVGAVMAYGREGEETPHPLTVCEIVSVEVQSGGIAILHTGKEM